MPLPRFTFAAEPWAIEPMAFARVAASLVDAEQFRSEPTLADEGESEIEVVDAVSIIPVFGVLSRRTTPESRAYFGEVDTDDVVAAIEQAVADESVNAIVLDFDSPGGLAAGMPEAAARVRRAAQAKPIIAFTRGTMASAAYYLASQATEIVASRSSSVGSIGTIISFMDYSAAYAAAGLKREVFTDGSPFKSVGLPGLALTDEQRTHLEARLQAVGADFRSDVKSARPRLHASAMRGQVFTGTQAIENGMVDWVGDESFAVARAKKLSAHR